jgi:hypothetical protein
MLESKTKQTLKEGNKHHEKISNGIRDGTRFVNAQPIGASNTPDTPDSSDTPTMPNTPAMPNASTETPRSGWTVFRAAVKLTVQWAG